MPRTQLGEYLGEWMTVTTEAQARLLSDSAALRCLEPFMGRTLGAAQAAQLVGVSIERLLYRLRQFLGAGLISEVGEQRRSGRAIRLYAAPGGFHVPFSLAAPLALEQQLAAFTQPMDQLRSRVLARELHRAEVGGLLFYRDRGGEVTLEVDFPEALGGPPARCSDLYMNVVHLSDVQATRVQHLLNELRAIHLSQGPLDQGPTRPYLLQMTTMALTAADLTLSAAVSG